MFGDVLFFILKNGKTLNTKKNVLGTTYILKTLQANTCRWSVVFLLWKKRRQSRAGKKNRKCGQLLTAGDVNADVNRLPPCF
jgi:hypothetical protein